MSIEDQAQLAESFVREVVARFGVTAETSARIVDDVIQVSVDGEGLGYLVGSRGSTVDALQELTRTVVQHRSDEHGNRIQVDVGGYRVRRAAALQDFARRVAADVIESGDAQALDPMPSSDRKIIHDAITEIGGVETASAGEEPRRYVVVSPAAVDATDDFSDEAEFPDADDEVSEPESGAEDADFEDSGNE